MHATRLRTLWAVLAILVLAVSVAFVSGCQTDTGGEGDTPAADEGTSDTEPGDEPATDDGAAGDESGDDDGADESGDDAGDMGSEEVSEGDAIIDARCTQCHSRMRVDNATKSRAEWESAVDRMIGYGADLTEDERETLIEHLATR